MPLPLDPSQSEYATGLHNAAETRYGESPVLFGQLRKDVRKGWEIHTIALRQNVARRIRTLLEAEKKILDSGGPLTKPKAPRPAPVKKKKYPKGELKLDF